jgi:hypothetical protein
MTAIAALNDVMPLVCFAGHRPLARAIAPVRPATSERRCQQPWPRSSSLPNPSPSGPPAVCSVSNKVIAISRTDRPHRPNPHRARPTLDTPSTRVRSLAVCRRRPRAAPRRSRPAGVRNPSQVRTLPRHRRGYQSIRDAANGRGIAPVRRHPQTLGDQPGCTRQVLPGRHHVGSMWISHRCI